MKSAIKIASVIAVCCAMTLVAGIPYIPVQSMEEIQVEYETLKTKIIQRKVLKWDEILIDAMHAYDTCLFPT